MINLSFSVLSDRPIKITKSRLMFTQISYHILFQQSQSYSIRQDTLSASKPLRPVIVDKTSPLQIDTMEMIVTVAS